MNLGRPSSRDKKIILVGGWSNKLGKGKYDW